MSPGGISLSRFPVFHARVEYDEGLRASCPWQNRYRHHEGSLLNRLLDKLLAVLRWRYLSHAIVIRCLANASRTMISWWLTRNR